jgi:uncharacterized paraquat-inducible protein A
MRIAAVNCPDCDYEFIIDVEFLEIEESYCHCPRCAREFKARESGKPVRT